MAVQPDRHAADLAKPDVDADPVADGVACHRSARL
jgi:hypothetical protein